MKNTVLQICTPVLVLALAATTWPVEHIQTLRTPATVEGFIGGESHDSYKVHARKGQVMTVKIAWRPEHDPETGDNRAQFWVEGDGAPAYGKEAADGKSWSGEIHRTGDYSIYVVAHPTAHYSLRVMLR